MKMNALFGVAATAVTLAGAMHPVTALADGPASAYANGGVRDPSLDPEEEQMTADEENRARQKDLSDAYNNGYTARAKEDADAYAQLREQVRAQKKALATQSVPPLPPGAPGNGGTVTPVATPPVAQRSLEDPGYAWQAAAAPPAPPSAGPYAHQQYAPAQYAPPQYAAEEYAAPAYATAPAYAPAAPVYSTVYGQPVYAEPVYEAPPPPIQYVSVPPAYVVAPIVTVAAAWLSGFRGYGGGWGGGWGGYRGGGRWR